MSIIYCKKHSQKWDSDRVDECPVCENEHPEVSDDELVKRLRGKGGHFYELRHEAADRIEANLEANLEGRIKVLERTIADYQRAIDKQWLRCEALRKFAADALDRYKLTKEIYSGSRFGENHNG